ncbi:MAG: hypothetical protein WBB91_03150 [Nostocoides sp.]|jgi:hypothetical protein|uniref:hypothetical protein n=2 Tax=Nostocoides sp. TaxID=1917966 RepID=UPI002CC5B18F|nr:hypothetical protein [Tetrasphaera sp.]
MKTPRRTASLAALSVLALTAVAAPALAGEARATITAPGAGVTVTGTSVSVKGGYWATASVKEVRVALCTLDARDICTSYLSDPVSGAMVAAYRSHPATLSPKNQTSGGFALTANKLAPARYRAAAFVVSNDTPKGPPAQVIFTLKKGDTPPPTGGFITIAFGRSQWSSATGTNCSLVPTGARTLEQNLADLKARGLKAQGGVIVARTEATTRSCYQQQILMPSWADLARLRDTYGFTAVSQGMNYADMTKMTTDTQRYQESGATLPIFSSKGFNRAWGMFNYPNDKMDANANRVVAQSFAFGRKYGTSMNTRAQVMAYPYLVKTVSVMGGKCNNRALPCYSMPVKNDRRTAPPSRLAMMLRPDADEWGVLQFYRIVEGSYGRMGTKDIAWDCTSTDWRNRWTSHPEMYCRNSFLEAIDGRSSTATTADAVQVAQAWGRTVG